MDMDFIPFPPPHLCPGYDEVFTNVMTPLPPREKDVLLLKVTMERLGMLDVLCEEGSHVGSDPSEVASYAINVLYNLRKERVAVMRDGNWEEVIL